MVTLPLSLALPILSTITQPVYGLYASTFPPQKHLQILPPNPTLSFSTYPSHKHNHHVYRPFSARQVPRSFELACRQSPIDVHRLLRQGAWTHLLEEC